MKKSREKGYRRKKVCAWLLLFCMVATMSYTPTLVRAEEDQQQKTELQSETTEQEQSEQNVAVGQEELKKEQPEYYTQEDSEVVTTNPQQSETTQVESYAVSSGNYDVTKPVIEEVILEEQGQTVNVSDTIHIKVKAYDAESEIRQVKIDIGRYDNKDGIAYVSSHEASYNSQTGYYECEYKVSEDRDKDYLYINSVAVIDVCSNMEQKYYSRTDYCCNVSGIGDSEGSNTTKMESITLKNEGRYLSVGDKETITIKPSEKPSGNAFSAPTASVSLRNNSHIMHISLPYDEQKGVYEKEVTISPRMKPGVWEISYIYIEGNHVANDSFQNKKILIENKNYQPLNITIKQHGQKLTTGETIDIVATDSIKELQDIGVNLSSIIKEVSPNNIYCFLGYEEQSQTYIGHTTISDAMYPCEWYVQNVSYSYDDVNYNEPINQEAASITISKNGTVVTPTANVNINFYKVDDQGNWTSVYQKSFEGVTSEDTLRSLGITELPDGKSSFENLAFEGWMKGNYNSESYGSNVNVLDSRVLDRGTIQPGITAAYTINYYARYDKDIVKVYANSFQNDKYTNVSETLVVPRNTTMEDVRSKYFPKSKGECNIAKFQNWEIKSYYDNGYHRSLWLKAKYDKAIVEVEGSYFANDNMYKDLPCPKAVAVDYGTSYGDVIRKLQGQLDNVQHHQQLGFTGWKYLMRDSMYRVVKDDTTLIEDGYEQIRITPTYQNCIVSIYVDKKDSEGESIYQKNQVVKKGDTFTLPTEVEGCTGLEWKYYDLEGEEDGEITKLTYVINSNAYFYGYAVPTDTSNTPKPDDSTNQAPTKGESTTNTGDATQPQESSKKEQNSGTITNTTGARNSNHTNAIAASTTNATVKEPTTLAAEKVQDIITTISETGKGESVTVEMGSATVIDKKILEAAKENGVNIVLQMEGYSWTIDAGSIKASDLQSINLEVDLNANSIPNKAVSKLAGNNPTKQISLTHEGNFGFSATLKFNLGKEYKDKYGNLYWYDSDGKMVFVDAGVIDENGDVSLRFSHASDYVIVMKDTKDTVDSTQVKNAQKASDKADMKQSEESKAINPVIWITVAIILMAGIVCGVMVSKKKEK